MMRSRSPSKVIGFVGSVSSRPGSRLGTPSKGTPTRPHSRAGSVGAASMLGFESSSEAGPSRNGPFQMSRIESTPSAEVVTKAEFWDVVIEDDEASRAILPWLGNLVTEQSGAASEDDMYAPDDTQMIRASSAGSINAVPTSASSRRLDKALPTVGNPARFEAQIRELIDTEKSYVRRIDALYNRYAKPLRQLARDREGAIMPLYEAQRLFGNIGELLGANMAFITELDSIVFGDDGMQTLKSQIGEVLHRHMACFGCYNDYFGNFEKAKHIEQTMSRSNRAFREFSDRIKQTTPNLGNVSIRELIMEPVQRIPRYKLLIDGLLKSLPGEFASQKARLEEAARLCSNIAKCEIDEKTQRAAILWSFGKNVQGFPAGLFSVHRRFIDAIDVEDLPFEGVSVTMSPSTTTSRPVPCTLFLFDDSLLVAKRSVPSSNGRSLLCLDDLERLADDMRTVTERSGSSVYSNRRAELGFRGVSDIMDISATDLGGADLQLVLKRPPGHINHEKWTNRPVRQCTTLADANTATPAGLEKARFLENLWRAQALYKTREGRSQLRTSTVAASAGESPQLDGEPKRMVFWNIYDRPLYLAESQKSNVLVQVTLRPDSDPIGLSSTSDAMPPHVILRIHSIDGEYSECNYSIVAKDRPAEDDIYVLSLDQLSSKVRQLNESVTLVDPRREALRNFSVGGSAPSTPQSHRGRVVTGLESFGRSLFSPGSVRSGDMFGSPRSPRRKGSILSKSSMATTIASDLFSSSSRAVSSAGTNTSVNSREMLATTSTTDSGGRLLPPSAVKSPRPADRPRAGSLGTPEVMISTRTSSRTGAEPDRRPRRPVSQFFESGADGHLAAPDRPTSALSSYSAASETDADQDVTIMDEKPLPPVSPSASRSPVTSRPSGPRALGPEVTDSPGRSPRRKPVPSAIDTRSIPYTATRRVTSSSSIKRQASEEYDGDSRRAHKRTAPPTPPKPVQTSDSRRGSLVEDYTKRIHGSSSRPLQPRDSNARSASNLSGVKSANSSMHSLNTNGASTTGTPPAKNYQPGTAAAPQPSTTTTLKGRLRRHLTRLDSTILDGSTSLSSLYEELSELRGFASQFSSASLEDLSARLEDWMRQAKGKNGEEKEWMDRVVGDVELLFTKLEESERAAAAAAAAVNHSTVAAPAAPNPTQAPSIAILQTRIEALQRKCSLLTTLESDGRLENEELHKAFNEELDRLYEDANPTLPAHSSSGGNGSDDSTEAMQARMILALRDEVKRSKRERNEAHVRERELKRRCAMAEAERDVLWRRLEQGGK